MKTMSFRVGGSSILILNFWNERRLELDSWSWEETAKRLPITCQCRFWARVPDIIVWFLALIDLEDLDTLLSHRTGRCACKVRAECRYRLFESCWKPVRQCLDLPHWLNEVGTRPRVPRNVHHLLWWLAHRVANQRREDWEQAFGGIKNRFILPCMTRPARWSPKLVSVLVRCRSQRSTVSPSSSAPVASSTIYHLWKLSRVFPLIGFDCWHHFRLSNRFIWNSLVRQSNQLPE